MIGVRPTQLGDLTLVALEGEIDLGSAARLARELSATLTTRPQALVLDAARVSFLDSAGLRVILDVAAQCQKQGCAIALCRVPDVVRRVLTTMHVEGIPLYENLSDATESLLYAAVWR